MWSDLQARAPGSATMMLRGGVVLGVLLMVGLAVLLHEDRQARIAAAQRQSIALATGVDRLLHYGLRNIERAMLGIAADAVAWSTVESQHAEAQLVESIGGVVGRQSELHSIVLVDAAGRSLSRGEGDPSLPDWAAHSSPEDRLVVGPLQRVDGPDGWWLRLALPFDGERWLLARLRIGEIDRMIRDLDIGRDGSVTVLSRDGTVLARLQSGDEESFVGRRIRLPKGLQGPEGTTSLQMVSELDGIERTAGFSAVSGYAVVVAAGIGIDEALAPWHRHVIIVVGLALLYWAGLAYLVHRLSAAGRVRAELLAELEAQAQWLDQAQQAARIGVWRMVGEDQKIRVSEHTAAMFGFEPVAMVLPADHFFERMHPDDRSRVEREFAEMQQTGAAYVTEYRVLLDDGGERWISARGGRISDSGGQQRITGTVVDITRQREAQLRIERAEAQFRALFERNPLPFWVFDPETLRFLAVNEAAVAAYGYSVEEFLAMTILDIRPVGEADAVLESMRARQADEDADGIWTHQRKDGSRFDVRVFSSGIEFAGRRARLVLAEDVSDRVAYERDLAWRASHDASTGLPTLASLTEQLDALHGDIGDSAGSRYVVAYVRLRDLELVAPTLGRRTSETLLREIAARISLVGEEFGMAGYWPGESFVVVALDATRRSALLAALEAIIAAPVEIEGGAHPIEASIGIAEGPEPGEDADQVVGHAALAALHAWQEQVPTLPYARAMAEEAAERVALARRLRDALRNEEFELHYQPIRRLWDNRIVAVEALLRWRQDDGTYVPPGVFVPLAEASGLIVPIGRWVLEQAARDHVRMTGQGWGHVAIAVNVSAVQLLADNVAETICRLQREHGLPRDSLHVELTESVVVRRPHAARACMQELRAAGVKISIDDFGTGFSSMAYLRNLPLDCLKIDRSFVSGVHADQRNATICRALIALARGLGLGTIAEGVEHADELEWLTHNGCDQAQGYHLGRPAPLERLLGSTRDAA